MNTREVRELPADLERFSFEDEESFELAHDVAELADSIAMEVRPKRPWTAYQLGRSGLSVLNNTAEARGEYSPGDKARFYRYAIRSASETAAMIVFLGRKSLISLVVEVRARRLLLAVMKLLTRRSIHFHRQSRKYRNQRKRGTKRPPRA